jgi:hypothetical protein
MIEGESEENVNKLREDLKSRGYELIDLGNNHYGLNVIDLPATSETNPEPAAEQPDE